MKLLRSGGIAKRIPRTLRVRRGPVVKPVRSDYAERMSNGPPHASPGLVALVVGEGRFADRVQIAYRTSNRRVLRNRSTAGGRKAGETPHDDGRGTAPRQESYCYEPRGEEGPPFPRQPSTGSSRPSGYSCDRRF